MIQVGWLWDKKVSSAKARYILRKPENQHFLSISAALLARNNVPREVFNNFLDPVIFLNNWRRIKRQMRKDIWNNPRIEFWQAVYEKLKEKYEAKGIFPNRELVLGRAPDEFCKKIGEEIRAMRKLKGLTQGQFAKALKVSQQMVSRIESGRENLSLLTLKNIASNLGKELQLNFS